MNFDAAAAFTQAFEHGGSVIADAGDEAEAGDDDAVHAASLVRRKAFN
jgi:hypothetical protein